MDIYDVNSYTDEELITDVLELSRPTDRELEARIAQLMRRYARGSGPDDARLYAFFASVYDRFFESDEQQDEQQDIAAEETQDIAAEETQDIAVEDTQDIAVEDTQDIAVEEPLRGDATQRIRVTKQVDLIKGKINPLLLQTIRRVVSVDSKYRDTGSATEFTFELSDPLKDVVALRLYSVGIPYTWYTVNNDFGSNFLLINGKVAGIENDTYTVTITPGNYTASTLVVTANAALQETIAAITDASFGTTQLTYDENTSLTTFQFDINRSFAPGSYYMEFPSWTSPSQTRTDSIPAFLGFANSQYYLNEFSSLATVPATIDPVNSQQTFVLTSTNKNVTIHHYVGPDDWTPSSTIVDTYTLTLALDPGTYSRNQLRAALNTAILNATFLDATTRLEQVNNQHCFFMHFDRYQVLITPNSRMRVVFPVDTGVTAAQRVWVGAASAFRFEHAEYTVSDVTADVTAVPDTTDIIDVASSPYFDIVCVRSGYVNAANNYQGTLANTPTGAGVSPTGVVALMNDALDVIKANSVTYNDPAGEVHPTNSRFFVTNDANIAYALDIDKSFTEKNYDASMVDATTFFYSVLNMTQTYDLSANNTIATTFNTNVNYIVDASLVMRVLPDAAAPIDATEFFEVNLDDYVNAGRVGPPDASYAWTYPNPSIVFTSFEQIAPFFNYLFDNFSDAGGDSPLLGTALTVSLATPGVLNASLEVNILKSLSELDFTLQFTDPAYAGTDPNNLWTGLLNFKNSFVDTATSLAVVAGETVATDTLTENPLTINTITIDNNGTVVFRPWETGVAAAGGENDITLTVPNGQYTRTELITALNAASSVNGTDVFVVENDYVRVRPTAFRTYTSDDYQLVLYDNEAFVKCYTGVTSVRNTTADATLGWVMGFRNYATYDFSNNVIVGDGTVVTELYNKLFIVVDDFNQSRINDGLVTNSRTDGVSTLPSYGTRNRIVCSATSDTQIYDADQPVPETNNRLTANQIYAFNAIAEETAQRDTTSGLGPYANDVFAVIPIRTTSLQSGEIYTEFGGTLQNQERVYFGPVNIRRMTVRLVSDRGNVIDLNGSDWTFSLIAEQLYQSSTQ